MFPISRLMSWFKSQPTPATRSSRRKYVTHPHMSPSGAPRARRNPVPTRLRPAIALMPDGDFIFDPIHDR
jgi:hypothetical protein